MKNRWVVLLIIVLTLGAAYIDLPAQLSLGNNGSFSRQTVDLNIGGWRFTRDLEVKKGLDLAGGTQLTLVADMNNVAPPDRGAALDSLKSIIERRVNLYGVAEPVVQTARVGGDYRIVVELAGVSDVNEALSLIGKTAELSFREEISASDSAKVSSASAEAYGPFQIITDLTGKDLRKAEATFDPNKNEPVVQLTFSPEGTKKWEDITRRNVNKRVAIVLDDQILLAPTVISVIPDGRAIITGGFTPAQAKQTALLLNSGALPAPVKVEQQRTIGATLGQNSVDRSMAAGLVGLSIVALFMIANYGKLGFFADLALIIYSLLVLAVFKLVPVTLTLAGIAGFVLSIGMAVDANILIFERMREEIRWGRNRMAAIELGFARAFPSIRDSNASSLITCAILYWFGTGSVRGFAVTLAIGILLSLFTAITVTRTLLRLANQRV